MEFLKRKLSRNGGSEGGEGNGSAGMTSRNQPALP